MYSERGSILVFVDKQEHADDLMKDLMKHSYTCLSLHGGIDQYDRDSIIHDFKSGTIKLLVIFMLYILCICLKLLMQFFPPFYIEPVCQGCLISLCIFLSSFIVACVCGALSLFVHFLVLLLYTFIYVCQGCLSDSYLCAAFFLYFFWCMTLFSVSICSFALHFLFCLSVCLSASFCLLVSLCQYIFFCLCVCIEARMHVCAFTCSHTWYVCILVTSISVIHKTFFYLIFSCILNHTKMISEKTYLQTRLLDNCNFISVNC